MRIISPQTHGIAVQCGMLTEHKGYRIDKSERDGWRRYDSTTAPGSVWLACDEDGHWWLALDHGGVVDEFDQVPSGMPGPGLARYRFDTTTEIHEAVGRVYDLSMSLPDSPLIEFQAKIAGMPRITETERLAVQRIGQGIFRDRLLLFWKGRCPMTGISEPSLLRASHIKPWRDCDTDSDRLNVQNGILLSALWDAAFDAGLVSFRDDGRPQYSSHLDLSVVDYLSSGTVLRLNDTQRCFMKWHRSRVYMN